MAKPFTLTPKEKAAPKPAELVADLVQDAGQLCIIVASILALLQTKVFLSTSPREAPEETVKRLLANSSPFAADVKRPSGTKASIAAMVAGHAAEGDQILVLLNRRPHWRNLRLPRLRGRGKHWWLQKEIIKPRT